MGVCKPAFQSAFPSIYNRFFGHIQIKHNLEENSVNFRACSTKYEQQISNSPQLGPENALVLIVGSFHL